MDPRLKDLATQLKLDPARVGDLIDAAARIGLLEVRPATATPAGAARALGGLCAFVEGRLPASEMPDALEDSFTGIGRRMELRDIPWEKAAARPKIPGLPEAAFAIAEAKERMRNEMTNAPADPARLRLLGARVLLIRETLARVQGFARWLEADLAVDEGEAARLVRDAYEPVRTAAQRNRALGGLLAAAEEYCFGSARKGVETRTDRARLASALGEKATAAAHARGVEDGVRLASERMTAALAGMRREEERPATPEPDRRGSDRG